jgi:hypothetical protein
MSQRKQIRDPNKTKTGKIRLGGLTVTQLTAMVEKEGKKKVRARILNRIRIVQSRKGSAEKVVAATATE